MRWLRVHHLSYSDWAHWIPKQPKSATSVFHWRYGFQDLCHSQCHRYQDHHHICHILFLDRAWNELVFAISCFPLHPQYSMISLRFGNFAELCIYQFRRVLELFIKCTDLLLFPHLHVQKSWGHHRLYQVNQWGYWFKEIQESLSIDFRYLPYK